MASTDMVSQRIRGSTIMHYTNLYYITLHGMSQIHLK